MNVRALFPIAAAAGMWFPAGLMAQQPAPTPAANPNQTLADSVAARLRVSGVAMGADVAIATQEGTVLLTGTAKDAGQKERILREAKTVTGVIVVRDGISLPTPGIIRIQGGDVFPAPIPPMPLAPGGGPPVNYNGGPIVEPGPLGGAGGPGADMQAPNLPPYAWPTYAPHNNVSRVAYPQAYPYNAFPFIGPFYPFPKVPLGWRKVTLEWEDGHWYLGRTSAPHDYWRTKFQ